MTTLRETLTTALTAVLPNTWAMQLPPSPTWPAAVFDIDTTPEQGWCAGGGYDQHEVNLVIFSETAEALETLETSMRTAFEALPQFMREEDSGDADYEGGAKVYGRFLTMRMRTRRT